LRKRKFAHVFASLVAVAAFAVSAGPLVAAPADAATVSAPPAVTANSAGFGALEAHQIAGVDTCTEVRKNLAALAKAGHRAATCIEPAATVAGQAIYSGLTSAAVRPATLPSWCTTKSWQGTRFAMCYIQSNYILNIDTETGEQIGFADYSIVDNFTLSWNSQLFSESFSLQLPVVTGTFAGMTLNVVPTCGNKTTCIAAGGLTDLPIEEGETYTTKFAYSDTTRTVDENYIRYTMTSGPGTIVPASWTSPPFRCDNEIAGAPAGCVVPGIAPVLTTMTKTPAIAANIRAIQAAGPQHYGREADGKPLTRNSSLNNANRAVACPSSVTAPAGKSCDEYPFATTDQGASKTKKPNWGTAWVPVSEQNSQGGYLSNFYQEYRVMDGNGTGDAFWVAV
jgi:hypothetical protein